MAVFTRPVLSLTLFFLFCCGTSLAQKIGEGDDETAQRLFSSLAGHWSCEDKFANGRSIAADVQFTLRFDGRALAFEHRDRAPNQFVTTALWGPDSQNHQLVSAGFAGTPTAPSPARFIAKNGSAQSLTLEANTLTSPPFAPNRSTYSLAGMRTN